MQLHFHISRHIAHLGWETPVFFTLFTLSTYGTVVSNCFVVKNILPVPAWPRISKLWPLKASWYA
jgi:hypothetical protein